MYWKNTPTRSEKKQCYRVFSNDLTSTTKVIAPIQVEGKSYRDFSCNPHDRIFSARFSRAQPKTIFNQASLAVFSRFRRGRTLSRIDPSLVDKVFPLALHHLHILEHTTNMTKSSLLLAAAVIAGSASAFAPPASSRASTKLFEDAVAEPAPVEEAFCRGYVGGEGPEPIPFSIDQSSVNWDPMDFAGVSRDACIYNIEH